MKARQLIASATYSPDELRVLFEAFDSAWSEIASDVSTSAEAVESARLSLAEIVLSFAQTHPIHRDSIKAAAVEAFRLRHRLP